MLYLITNYQSATLGGHHGSVGGGEAQPPTERFLFPAARFDSRDGLARHRGQ
jgi:hypothetical protein